METKVEESSVLLSPEIDFGSESDRAQEADFPR
jgi:hypothetical protein